MQDSDTPARTASIQAEDENAKSDMKASAKPLPAHLFYFMGIHFLLAFCEIVLAVPLIKLFEQSLCFSSYSDHDPSVIKVRGSIPEALCKTVEIQQDLATIRGWKSLLDIVPGMVKSPLALTWLTQNWL
jgi:hypothetical protein